MPVVHGPAQNIGLIEFKKQWEALGQTVEVVKKYSLGLNSIQEAVDAVCGLLGMTACENSGKVADNAQTHGTASHSRSSAVVCEAPCGPWVFKHISCLGLCFEGTDGLCCSLDWQVRT